MASFDALALMFNSLHVDKVVDDGVEAIFSIFAILIEGVFLGAFCSAPSIENGLVSSRSSDTSFLLQE